MEFIKALQIIRKGLKKKLFSIQMCASALGSSEVMDHLHLFMKSFTVSFNFKLTNSGLGTLGYNLKLSAALL